MRPISAAIPTVLALLVAGCSDERATVSVAQASVVATEAFVPCRGDDAPATKLATILGAMDGTKTVPAMIAALAGCPSPLIPAGTFAGAVVSPSLQQSQGLADPRVLLYTPCFVFTYTLLGKSIEVALQDITPTLPVMVDGQPRINP